jgi:hypothetical protein
VKQAQPGQLVPQALRVNRVPPELLALRALRVKLELRARLELQAKPDRRVPPVK